MKKQMNPNSISISNCIKQVLTLNKYGSMREMEAGFLYNIIKEHGETIPDLEDELYGLKKSMYKKIQDKYLEYLGSGRNNFFYSPSTLAKDFYHAVNARRESLVMKKHCYSLFDIN